jgi:hypothetical protein
MESKIIQLLDEKEYESARELLQSILLKGEIIDPRTDRLWAPIADTIAQRIRDEKGIDATIPYWEALLNFFTDTIEPTWGHAHKGHIYFRLALPIGRHNLEKARTNLIKAREEDFILQRRIGGTEKEILERAQKSSSHVALALIERIEDTDFSSPEEKEQFSDNLFGPSFDAAIQGKIVRPDLVEASINRIVPDEMKPITFSLYRELSMATEKELQFTTASLIGTVLESIILGILFHQKAITTLPSGKNILEAELGPLLNEAISRKVFPSTAVQATMQLVHLFRNRLHPGNEYRQDHKLTPRVSSILKILFDLALVEWSQSVPQPI